MAGWAEQKGRQSRLDKIVDREGQVPVRRLDRLGLRGRVRVNAEQSDPVARRLSARLSAEYPSVEVRIQPEGKADSVFNFVPQSEPSPSSYLIREGENFHFEVWDSVSLPRTVLSDCRLGIEGYNRCNATCGMCPVRSMRRLPQVMPLALSDSILRQVASHPELQIVNFYLHGEPLLDPYLEARIRCASVLGIPYLRISTNGVLLTGDRMVSLAEAGLDEITVSLDGATADVHEQLRPGTQFATIVDNVQTAIRLKRKRHWVRPAIMLGMIVGDSNRSAVEPLIRLAADWFGTPILESAPRLGIVYRDDMLGLGMFISERFDWITDYSDRSISAIQPGPCPGHRDLVVYSNGKAAFCCLDVDGDHVLGDLKTETFDAVFLGPHRSESVRAIAERDLPSIPPRCQRCWLLYHSR